MNPVIKWQYRVFFPVHENVEDTFDIFRDKHHKIVRGVFSNIETFTSDDLHFITSDPSLNIYIESHVRKLYVKVRMDRGNDGKERWKEVMTQDIADDVAQDIHLDFDIEQLFANSKGELLMFRAMAKLSERQPFRVFAKKTVQTATCSTLMVTQTDVEITSSMTEGTQKYRTLMFRGPLFNVNTKALLSIFDSHDYYVGSWSEFLSTVIEKKPLNLYQRTLSTGLQEEEPDEEEKLVLPPLPSLDDEKLSDIIMGPTPYSNWVIPGYVLVGAWIGSDYDDEKDSHLKAVIKAGVNVFVSLVAEKQQTYKDEIREHYRQIKGSQSCHSEPNSPKTIFIKPTRADRPRKSLTMRSPRSPPPRSPASPIKQRSGSIPNVQDDNGWDDDSEDGDLRFLRYPINDYERAQNTVNFQQFLNELISLMRQGKVLYLHCLGGHGRTGMAAAYLLGALYDISVDEALKRTQLYHDLRKYSNRYRIPKVIKSPQTDGQSQQVRMMLNDNKSKSQSRSSSSGDTNPFQFTRP